MFKLQQYAKAAIAYEYAVFRSDEPALFALALEKKAMALKQLERFEEAFQALQRIDVYSQSDTIAQRLLYQMALTAFLSEKYDIALSKIVEGIVIPSNRDKFDFDLLEILALNNLRRWEEARQKFLIFKQTYAVQIVDPYSNPKLYQMKKLKTAETLSYFLPGTGQWYAGAFGKGVTSALINGLFVTFAAVSFWNGFYFSGMFTGVSLFYIFYNGGIRHATVLAEQYNNDKADRFNHSVQNVLLQVAGKKQIEE